MIGKPMAATPAAARSVFFAQLRFQMVWFVMMASILFFRSAPDTPAMQCSGDST
jgi:hypothetical protein